MAEEQEDFSQLPLPDRFTHKLWKVRKEGYEDAAKTFEKTPDESDPAFRPFIQDAGLWKGAAGDSNVAAQQEGLAALCSFLKYGGYQAATRSRPHTVQPIYEKGLSSTRPAAKANALEALLLYVEIDKPDLVIEELLPALGHKQPKIVAATLAAMTAIFHNFGVKIVQPKAALKTLPKAFGHADKNVRAEASNLTVELYRWLKDALKPLFWDDLKPVQQSDLEKLFEKVRDEPSPKQERFTRAQQAEMASASATVGDDVGGEAVEVEAEDEEAVELDAFDLAEPQDCLSKVPENYSEMINSTKWKDRKDTLDELFKVLSVPRIKGGAWDEVIRGLTKSMKDANVAVVTVAANCIEKLSLGLRKDFAKYRSTVMTPIMERLKEKKQSVADALGGALDGVFMSTSLTDCLEEIIGFLSNKNPNVKDGSIKFLVRCLRTTKDVPSKDEQKTIAGAGTKLLTESTEAVRAGGAEILGTLMKILGERAMGPYLDGLDDIRKTKIKEFFDTAEVKAKEKPKKVAPPPKPTATSAAGKRVVGGAKKPVAKKPLGAVPPADEPVLAPKPTAKALPKPGGVPKPGLTGGLKLGGLKKPGMASPQPRRVISPPIDHDGEDEPPVTSPSKFGLGRGLAGRSLARPTATPMSPPPQAAPAGMSAIERAEMEDLRAERERLSSIAESLRSSNAKLTAEISELQNQNAQLIEDHTRDVLQIKAKETQLTRARGECDVLRTEMESLKKESERYKREVSRLGRESFGREREDTSRERSYDDENGNGIYDDNVSRFGANGRTDSRPNSRSFGLERTGSGASISSRPTSTKPVRPMSGFTNNSLSPSDEKENNGLESTLMSRRKISPPVNNGSMSPVRPSASSNDSGSGQTENWKRAAEVTSQLKARIEAMKARQLPRNQ